MARELQAQLLERRGQDPYVIPFYSNSAPLGVLLLLVNVAIMAVTLWTAIFAGEG